MYLKIKNKKVVDNSNANGPTRTPPIPVQRVHKVHRIDDIEIILALSRVAAQRALETRRGGDRHGRSLLTSRAVRQHTSPLCQSSRVSQKSNLDSHAPKDNRSNERRDVSKAIACHTRGLVDRVGLNAVARSKGRRVLSSLCLYGHWRAVENTFK